MTFIVPATGKRGSARDLSLATARQGDLDTWLTSQPAGRREAGHFVRWAKHHKLTSLDFAATKWDGPTGVIDTQARWTAASGDRDKAKTQPRKPGLGLQC